MRKSVLFGTIFSVIAGFSVAAQASILAKIDLTNQKMNVVINGQQTYSWKISSGRKGYYTPNGKFRPYRMEKMHYSTIYDNAPMPHSIFFLGGYAIHGTDATGMLGRPASHGCVRLNRKNAALLFGLVKKYGSSKTRITVSGTTPISYKPNRKIAKSSSAASFSFNPPFATGGSGTTGTWRHWNSASKQGINRFIPSN